MYDYFGEPFKENKKYVMYNKVYATNDMYNACLCNNKILHLEENLEQDLFQGNPIKLYKRSLTKEENDIVANKDVIEITMNNNFIGINKNSEAKTFTFSANINPVVINTQEENLHNKFKIFSLREFFPELKKDYKAFSLLTSKEDVIDGLIMLSDDCKNIYEANNCKKIGITIKEFILPHAYSSIYDNIIPLSDLFYGNKEIDIIINNAIFYLIPLDEKENYNP